MFELKDLPNRETLAQFAKLYDNPDVSGLHTWLLWAAATNEMLTAFEDNLARNGLSQTQFFVLLLLKRNPEGLSVGALADGVAITSQSMTRAVAKMEAAGICSKHADPEDGRLWIVRMTSTGEAILRKVLPRHYAWVASFMSHYDEKEREALVKLMRKVGPALGVSPLLSTVE
ncbi:MarR family winged helix-turn-helix transcriptional regulator [Variovorax sp. M-6]|uniref:MarR family winged helix-turn-helix transcriptional regulator n=1 Tax=Variovorax sp. M-6 TaxID=3233041 RepID=UPI003F9C5035